MKNIFLDLKWLPKAPKSFKENCNEIFRDSTNVRGSDIILQSSYALNINQISSLAKKIVGVTNSNVCINQLLPFRLGIISNATISMISPTLIVTAARYGILLDVIEAPYGQIYHAISAEKALFKKNQLDAVFIFLDYRALFKESEFGNTMAEKDVIDKAVSYIGMIRDKVSRQLGVPCIIPMIPTPPENIFGSFDALVSGTYRHIIGCYNDRLISDLKNSSDILFDLAGLAEAVGTSNYYDPLHWNLYKLPFNQNIVPIFSEFLCRIIAAVKGNFRKCLVLDLDNTLWGGVIGDDGIEGIELGQGNAIGEAFLNIQKMALRLYDRGIILSVASKNEEKNARLPFQNHPEMILKEEHISIFQANWSDKAGNIRKIAETLNISLQSIVFLDDNPVERAFVRQVLPMVGVPELPDDPSYYPMTLHAAGYFESVSFSDEDRERGHFYKLNAEREKACESFENYDTYLVSLEMTMSVKYFDLIGKKRIVQLINKTNQFNLTTKRYTEKQIDTIMENPLFFGIQIRLIDKFGDNGMISIVLCKRTESEWEIDTWLMSCRVFDRKVENAVFKVLVDKAKESNIGTIRSIYLPTEKNSVVKNLYEKLGFNLITKSKNGETEWIFRVCDYKDQAIPMKIDVDL